MDIEHELYRIAMERELYRAYSEACDTRREHAESCQTCAHAWSQCEPRGEACPKYSELDRQLDGAMDAWLWYEPELADEPV
jgi:hypothetical protein